MPEQPADDPPRPPRRRWAHRLAWAWLALCGLGLVAAELRTPGGETCRTR